MGRQTVLPALIIDMKKQVLHYATILGLAVLIAACAAPTKHQDDEIAVEVDVGVPDCIGCNAIKIFSSQTLASELYAVRDDRNVRTGERVSASLELRISNRKSWIMGGITAPPGNTLFEGEVQTDKNHPYRFLLHIHHNSSFTSQDVYLATVENKYFPLPPVNIEGIENKQSCFRSGCGWDADYVLPATVVNDHLTKWAPLTIFVGNHVSKQVQSKDGLNASYETMNAGAFLHITPEQLYGFVANVRRQLGLQPTTPTQKTRNN